MASILDMNNKSAVTLDQVFALCKSGGMVILKALKKGWEKSGMTYQEFADLVGISMSSAHKKLNGAQVLTLEDAEAWAKILKVSVSARLK